MIEVYDLGDQPTHGFTVHVNVMHIYRQTNTYADKLANWSLFHELSFKEWSCALRDLKNFLLGDVSTP